MCRSCRWARWSDGAKSEGTEHAACCRPPFDHACRDGGRHWRPQLRERRVGCLRCGSARRLDGATRRRPGRPGRVHALRGRPQRAGAPARGFHVRLECAVRPRHGARGRRRVARRGVRLQGRRRPLDHEQPRATAIPRPQPGGRGGCPSAADQALALADAWRPADASGARRGAALAARRDGRAHAARASSS